MYIVTFTRRLTKEKDAEHKSGECEESRGLNQNQHKRAKVNGPGNRPGKDIDDRWPSND